MRIQLLLVAFLILTSCNSQVNKKIRGIDLETLKKEVIGKDVQFVDVRTEKEYLAGHIDDAININVLNETSFNEKIKELDKSKPVYVYCRSGMRSNKASKIMVASGFMRVYDFSGGWSAWSKQ